MLKDLGKSVVTYGIASGISKSIMIFLVPVYTRIFSPNDYGIIDLIQTVISFIAILGMLQLESAIARYYFEVKDNAKRKRYISTAFWTILSISLILGVGLSLVSDLISLALFKTENYGSIIMLASIIIPSTNLFALLSTLMRFLKKPVMYSLFIAAQLLITTGLSIWFVVFEEMGIIGVFYGQLLGILLVALAMTYYLRNRLEFTWDKQILFKMFHYSLPMVPAVAGNWANTYANRFIMLGYLTITDIGLFTVALKIASVFRLMENAFRMAWGPYMWETLKNANHRKVYDQAMKYTTVITFFLVAGIALFAYEILDVLTTKSYMKSADLVGLLSFAIGLDIVFQIIGPGPAIIKKTIYNTIIFFISVSINIGSLFVLVPLYGLIGVPIALLLSKIVMIIVAWYISERLYYIGFSIRFFIIGFIITAAIVIIPLVYQMHPLHKMVVFVILICLSVIIYKQMKNDS